MIMTEFIASRHAVVRNEFLQHREAILAKPRRLPDCKGSNGVALRADYATLSHSKSRQIFACTARFQLS